jgi:ethanolamine-phosphate cytidylyltransferase
LIVGIHGDAVVNRERGMNLPLMNLHERVLSVLGCRYVSDVLIDAPYEVTEGLLASLNVAEVVRVHYHHPHNNNNDMRERRNPATEDRRYRVAKTAGLFHEVHIESTFAIKDVVARIQRNQEAFQARFERKKRAEDEYTVTKSLLQQ